MKCKDHTSSASSSSSMSATLHLQMGKARILSGTQKLSLCSVPDRSELHVTSRGREEVFLA